MGQRETTLFFLFYHNGTGSNRCGYVTPELHNLLTRVHMKSIHTRHGSSQSPRGDVAIAFILNIHFIFNLIHFSLRRLPPLSTQQLLNRVFNLVFISGTEARRWTDQ